MSGILEAAMKQSKRAAAHISKFHYHLQYTVPECFPRELLTKQTPSSSILQTKKGLRNTTFHFAEQQSEGVSTLDAEAILLSALKIYIGPDCIKLSDSSYKKTKTIKASFFSGCGTFSEIVQFYIVDLSQDHRGQNIQKWVKKISTSRLKQQKESEVDSSGIRPAKKALSNNFELYVIHHCLVEKEDANQMKWENFIEKYHFKEEIEAEEPKPKIHYRLIFNYPEEQGVFSYFSSRDKLYEHFIREHLSEKQGELRNINLFQGYLLQSQDRVAKKLQELNDPAFDESHKKWLKLSPEYFKMFTALRKHAIKEHRQAHGDKEHLSELALSSLAYRYMHAKEYNFKECQDHITEYMKWQKHLSETYNLVMFERFHGLDFYTFLGNDHEGRCVILNKSSKLIIDNIDSIQDYCAYFCYFLEVFVPRKLKGYAEQYTVLADLQGLSSSNFKLAITKQNVNDGLKYCPERQYKFIAFNVGKFATTLWLVIKNLLPSKTLSKIKILGEDSTEILSNLLEEMDICVIPEYLGGSNKRTYKDDLHQQRIYLKQRSSKKQEQFL